MRSRFAPFRGVGLGLLLFAFPGVYSPARADDPTSSLSSDEARERDLTAWRELLRKDDYDALEKIADDLRATKGKYINGRGRLWRFCWTASPDQKQEREQDYQQALQSLDNWLAAKPKSINVRLLLAKVWYDYAFFARGGRFAPLTPEAQLKTFSERCETASKQLDAIPAEKIDNVCRRLRIDIAKGLGEKPDVNLVYDGLKDDPACMELVHGMSICLLPRWFGEDGELEEFADEVARRTKETCGEMQYVTAALATKEFLKTHTLETHRFDWPRLRQGFRDYARLYPQSREHLDEETQFAFMAGDLEAVYATLEQLGDQPRTASWKYSEIEFGPFRQRFKPDMMQGDQKRLLIGHARPVFALETIADGKLVASMRWDSALRVHDVATGERRGWTWLDKLRGESASIHPKTGLLAGGSFNDPGVMLFSFANGQSGGIAPSEEKYVKTTFSPKGDLLAAADEKGVVFVVDLKNGKTKHEFKAEEKREISSLAFSTKAERLAAGCASGDLVVFDLENDKLEATYKFSNHRLPAVAWFDSHLVAGTVMGGIAVLEWPSQKSVAVWDVQRVPVASLAFSPKGDKLAIGFSPGDWNAPVESPLFLWNYKTDKEAAPLKGHKLGVNCVRFADGGKTLLSGSHDWTIRVWDVP